jgi:hypothetical protein
MVKRLVIKAETKILRLELQTHLLSARIIEKKRSRVAIPTKWIAWGKPKSAGSLLI